MPRLPADLDAERRRWRAFQRVRPGRVEPAGPGEESVWDYPRPPRLEASTRRVRIEHAGRLVAESRRALRVCETASPPVYYVPVQDVAMQWLRPGDERSFCEWKGVARYWTLAVEVARGRAVSLDAAFDYPAPDAPYQALRDHLAFYPGRVDAAWLDDERVRPQPGDYYAGWITNDLRGPFKGEPGTGHW